MALWQQTPNLQQLNGFLKNTIGEQLDIRFESFDDESLTASMVVDARTHQPYGLLHGGASVVLAETLGSPSNPLQMLGLLVRLSMHAWRVLSR
jgi:acyl-coenzyme A thioesterase PaaI-like protein